jgi:hypothetical protein
MTDNQLQEKISALYLGALAIKSGYLLDKLSDDFGVDWVLRQVQELLSSNGKKRYLLGGLAVDVQLKSTTKYDVDLENGVFPYDAERKTYNDLVWRAQQKADAKMNIPLALVLVVLPPISQNRISVADDQDKIILTGKAYWFQMPPNTSPSTNRSTRRIKIPLANQLTPDTFLTFVQKASSPN